MIMKKAALVQAKSRVRKVGLRWGKGRSQQSRRGRVKIIKPPRSSCVITIIIIIWRASQCCSPAKGRWQPPQLRFIGLVGLRPLQAAADSSQECPPESCEAILDVHIRIVPPLTLTGRACEDIKLLTDLVLKQYRSPRLLPGHTT